MEGTASLILDIAVVLLVAAGAGWVARRIGLPSVVGYLLVGLAVSRFTPGYVADRHQIELLADVGVTLLLFEVGIEIDLLRLRDEQRPILLLAPLQVAITIAISVPVLLAVGLAPIGAALIGLGLASSSSVVIVNMTRSRRRTTNLDTERAMLGWGIVQDVAVVVAAVAILALGGIGERTLVEAAAAFAGFIALIVVAAWILPRVLVRLRSEHDLFLIVSVATGLLLAALGDRVFGLPLALAAFLAGLAISESPATAEARRRLVPFRDLFAVLFFVAVGSLIDPAELLRGLPLLGLLLTLLVGAKVVPVFVSARLARLARPAQLAIGLGQIGEFSFVLASTGVAAGAVAGDVYAATLGAVVLSIAASAVLVRRAGTRPVTVAESAGAASPVA
jgi:CPA2 family monovalent cation:H+ antiporter-2